MRSVRVSLRFAHIVRYGPGARRRAITRAPARLQDFIILFMKNSLSVVFAYECSVLAVLLVLYVKELYRVIACEARRAYLVAEAYTLVKSLYRQERK